MKMKDENKTSAPLDPNKIQLCRVGVHSAEAQQRGQPCDCAEGTCKLWKGGLKPAAPASTKAGEALTRAALDVLAERRRQVEVEGFTAKHDREEHTPDELARAASVYANQNIWDILGNGPVSWPWEPQWFKPKDARSNYVRAAALLIAAIELGDGQ